MTLATQITNWIILVLLIGCFAYQGIYFLILYIKKEKPHKEAVPHRFAILIAARNEEAVIAQLIESIKHQDYPAELIDTFVVADNCTDDTAEVAEKSGAIVYTRFNKIQVGKGYALNYLLQNMREDGYDDYDGYYIFDADNLLEKNYIKEMNQTFCDGYRVITSCRNTKNFGQNWLTSGYGLWFLHEAQWLNRARMLKGVSCAVSGTGFFFSREILERMGGEWNHFLLTEDIEFTISQILQGEKIGYCKDAVFYDEQPDRFIPSWHQRARWVKGYQQVFQKYGKQIWRGIWKEKNFSCYDMTMNIWPAFFLTLLSIFATVVLVIVGLALDRDISFVLYSAGTNLLKTYAMAGVLGAYTLFTEWKKIRATTAQKLLSILTFPAFMFTFAPIAMVALAKKVEWKPIEHRCTIPLSSLHMNE